MRRIPIETLTNAAEVVADLAIERWREAVRADEATQEPILNHAVEHPPKGARRAESNGSGARSGRLECRHVGMKDQLGRFQPDEDLWTLHLAETLVFFREHGRFPRVQEGGKWLVVQRHAARGGRLSERRRAQLDRSLPGWHSSGIAAWEQRRAQLAAFVEQHGRKPRARSNDEDERALGSWLQTQLGGSGRASRDPELRRRVEALLPTP